MRYRIRHRAEFLYTGPVFLEPQVLRLRPRCDGTQRLLAFQLRVLPEPAGLTEIVDVDGATTTHVWFNGTTERLLIEMESEVETLRANPFDYLPDPGAAVLPLRYPDPVGQQLYPYRVPVSARGPVSELAESVARDAGYSPGAFLTALTLTLHARCRAVIRDDGWPHAPEETLARGEGSCRDVAVLFMDAARWLGLAARFVSGYQEGDPDQDERHLHAWPEVFVPGGGWRGFDPMLGLAVADRHIALAAGVRAQEAAPFTGAFRGTGIEARLQPTLEITEFPAP
jgi:transglutaminase-like putative cysteine protease